MRFGVAALLIVVAIGIYGGNDGATDHGDGIRLRNGVSDLALDTSLAGGVLDASPSDPISAGFMALGAEVAGEAETRAAIRTPILWDVESGQGGLSAQDWHDLACAPQWTWPCWWVLATISCESSGNPLAVNWAGPYYGLLQVLNGSTDPLTNLLQGHQQFREWMDGRRQKSPWPSCAPVRP